MSDNESTNSDDESSVRYDKHEKVSQETVDYRSDDDRSDDDTSDDDVEELGVTKGETKGETKGDGLSKIYENRNLVDSQSNNLLYKGWISTLKERYNYDGETPTGEPIVAEGSLKERNRKKIEELNEFKQYSLFLLNESDFFYSVWKKVSFLNYLFSYKKQWGDNNFQGRKEIEQQLNYFKQNPEFNSDDSIVWPEDEHFIRMVYIDNMIKGIDLHFELLKINFEGLDEDKKTANENIRRRNQSKQSKESNAANRRKAYDDKDFVKWGKKQSKKGGQRGGGFFGRYNALIKLTLSAILFGIFNNSLMEKLDSFGPETLTIIQANFEPMDVPRVLEEMTETRTEWAKFELEFSGNNDAPIKKKDISKIIKERNLEHLREFKTEIEAERAYINQMKGHIVAIQNNIANTKSESDADGQVTVIKKENAEKNSRLLELYTEMGFAEDRVALREEELKKREEANDENGAGHVAMGNTEPISISHGLITKLCGGSAYNLIFKQKEDRFASVIALLENRFVKAIGRDMLEFTSKRVLHSTRPDFKSEEGNANSYLTQVSDLITNTFVSWFHGNNKRYTNAPGTSETLTMFQNRADLTRDWGEAWLKGMKKAGRNTVYEILVHMRTTSYWLWAYFLIMQSIQAYGINQMFRLFPGTNENLEDEEEGILLLTDNSDEFEPGLQELREERREGWIKKLKTCCRNIPDMENQGHELLGERGRQGVRGIKYLVIASIFNGLALSIGWSFGKPLLITPEPYNINFDDIFSTNIQAGKKHPPRFGSESSFNDMTLEKQLVDLRIRTDPEISKSPVLLRSESDKGDVDPTSMVVSQMNANEDKLRTGNSITIHELPYPEIGNVNFNDGDKNRIVQEKPGDAEELKPPEDKHGGRKTKKTRRKTKKTRRKTKKTRRKKRKGGRKKTRRKRKRRKRKRRKTRRKKTRRKR